MNKGQKLWQKAVKIIPGGNGLLSKRPERYLPVLWPTYYSRSKDICVWDLENNKFLDMAQMGMGVSILGYANNYVDNKVKKSIWNSNDYNQLRKLHQQKKRSKLKPCNRCLNT